MFRLVALACGKRAADASSNPAERRWFAAHPVTLSGIEPFRPYPRHFRTTRPVFPVIQQRLLFSWCLSREEVLAPDYLRPAGHWQLPWPRADSRSQAARISRRLASICSGVEELPVAIAHSAPAACRAKERTCRLTLAGHQENPRFATPPGGFG